MQGQAWPAKSLSKYGNLSLFERVGSSRVLFMPRRAEMAASYGGYRGG